MLFLYAVTFSYSYNTLNTGTGALLLFGSAQLTMIAFTVFMIIGYFTFQTLL